MIKKVFRTSLAENIYNQKYSGNGRFKWNELAATIADEVCGTMGGTKPTILPKDEVDQIEQIIEGMKALPGGRYLYYAGKPLHAWNNCYLLRGEADTREEWGSVLKRASDCLMTGGGIGVDYSVFRAEGSPLGRTGGTASGPLPLMKSVNEVGRNVMQGGSRRCLPEGALVHTQRGLVRIEDVIPGKDRALTPYGLRSITNLFDQGEQETIKIITQTGHFECTPNHKMAVLSGPYGEYEWKMAQDLEEGDRLLFSTLKTPGVKCVLPESSYVRPERAYTAKPVSIPELDEEIAWFIGYFHANGHSAIRNSTPTKRNSAVSVSIPNDATGVIEAVTRAFERFGVTPATREGCGACKVIKVASVEMALWIQEFVKQSNVEFDVPDFILQSGPEIRAAYVAGVMDGDGSVSSRPIQVMSCVHEGFLKQLQSVCASLGFATRLHCNRPEKGKWKALYRVLLKGSKQERVFYNTVGKYLKYKIEEPRTRKKESYSYSLTAGMIRNLGLPQHKKKYHQNYNVNCPIDLWESITGMVFPFTPIQVLGIEKGEWTQTWDIEVDDVHQFYCDGYLTHNSAIYASLNWQHGDARKFLTVKDWHSMPVGNSGYTIWDAKQEDFDFHAPLDMTNISLNYDDDWLYKPNRFEDETFVANCWQAMKTGEPGFSFNFGKNVYETLRNACCEVVSEDDSDVCNLGSVNMSRIETKEEFYRVCYMMSRFLVCGTLRADLPYDKVNRVREKNRRLGLGLMGIHEWLLKRGYQYEVVPELKEWLTIYKEASEKGANDLCDKLGISRPKAYRAIAPTGTIGMIAGTTTGIEPLFAVAYKRRYLRGSRWHYQYNIDGTASILINEYGLNPDSIVTAYDMTDDFERRVRFQADVQDFVDMAISSTINLPAWGSDLNNEDKVGEFAQILSRYAHRLRGFTAYPDGSRGGQPLTKVPYLEALSHGDVVYEENDACKGGVCGI